MRISIYCAYLETEDVRSIHDDYQGYPELYRLG